MAEKSDQRLDTIARAICQEQCAFYGEPPCFAARDELGRPEQWPNRHCNEPGCFALAQAAMCSDSGQKEEKHHSGAKPMFY